MILYISITLSVCHAYSLILIKTTDAFMENVCIGILFHTDPVLNVVLCSDSKHFNVDLGHYTNINGSFKVK